MSTPGPAGGWSGAARARATGTGRQAGAVNRRLRPGRPGTRRPWAWRGAAVVDAGNDRFGLLLLVLAFTYVFSAFTSGTWVSAVQIVLFVGVILLTVRTGHLRRGTSRLVVAVVAGGSAVAVTLALTHPTDTGAGIAYLWTALILLFAVVVIVARVLSQQTVTVQSIFGAVSAYMIIGLMFAAIFAAINRFGGPFFAGGEPGTLKTFQYFSFTTLTTLGYGDFTAAGSGGRAIAVMEALVGQVFLATLVARLVAAFRGPPRRPPARGRARTSRAGGPAGAPSGPTGTPSRHRPRVPHRAGSVAARDRVRRISSRARARPVRR